MNYGAIHSILLTVILLSASWAAFGAASGTAVSAILFASAAYFLVRESRWTRSIRIAAVVLGLSALVGLVLPATHSAREMARGMQCENHLRQIGIAVRNYWDIHGCYPPTCTYDKSGRPMHSWRSLIKEFMSSIPDKCNHNEPWDSPSNRQLLADRRLAYIYQCPTDKAACAPDSAATSYVAIVGKRATWRHGKAESPNHESTDQKLHNQAADAFLVIEIHDSGIQWTEPKDIDFDDVPALKSIAAKSSHARDHGYFYCKTPAVNAVLAYGDLIFMFPWDSRTSVLTGLLPPDELLLPPEERRRIERSRFKYDPYSQLFQEELRVDWPHVVGLPVWIVAVALLSYQGIVAQGVWTSDTVIRVLMASCYPD
jgi:Protein of unknown function (DUF1559)